MAAYIDECFDVYSTVSKYTYAFKGFIIFVWFM